MSKNTFGSVARAMKKAIKTGTIRALNKATSKGKTELTKRLRADTGLPNKTLNKRLLKINAKANQPRASVNVAVKMGVPLSEFSPKEKMVKSEGRPSQRKYSGVTVKPGGQPRELVKGAFLRTVRSGKKVVLGHKDTMDHKGNYSRGPTHRNKGWSRSPTSDALKESAKRHQRPVSKMILDEMNKSVNREIDFALTQLVDKK